MSVSIIGGGVSGLACGYRVSRSGLNVNVFESAPFLGGLASWYNYRGLNIPKTYHHILHSDTTLIQMLEELKLKIQWIKIKTGFYHEGNTYPFNDPFDLLRFKPLSFLDRLKLGLLVLSTRRAKQLENFEGVSIKDWITDKVGLQAYYDFIEPLTTSYFGSAENISAAYLANRWRTESKSITGMLGFIDVSKIVLGLEKEIIDHGGYVRRNAPVTSISAENDGFKLEINGEVYHSEYLVSTIPPSQLLHIMDSGYGLESVLGGVTYRSCICVTFWLEERLSDYYWINVLEKAFPFVACFEHANLNPHVKGGIVYAVTYLDEQNELWQKHDTEIANYFSKYLVKIFPKFKNPVHYEIFRTRWSTPIYYVGFQTPPLKTPLSKLYLAGISRIFPNIRSMGPAMQTGLEAADAVIRETDK